MTKKYLFNEYEDLINCKDIDVIYIALPNSLHHLWVIKSIQNKVRKTSGNAGPVINNKGIIKYIAYNKFI